MSLIYYYTINTPVLHLNTHTHTTVIQSPRTPSTPINQPSLETTHHLVQERVLLDSTPTPPSRCLQCSQSPPPPSTTSHHPQWPRTPALESATPAAPHGPANHSLHNRVTATRTARSSSTSASTTTITQLSACDVAEATLNLEIPAMDAVRRTRNLSLHGREIPPMEEWR